MISLFFKQKQKKVNSDKIKGNLFLLEMKLKDELEGYKTNEDLLIFVLYNPNIGNDKILILEDIFKKFSDKFDKFYLLANNQIFKNDNNLRNKLEGLNICPYYLNFLNYFYFLLNNKEELEKFKNIYVITTIDGGCKPFKDLPLFLPETYFDNVNFYINYIVFADNCGQDLGETLKFKLKNVFTHQCSSLSHVSLGGAVKMTGAIPNDKFEVCFIKPWEDLPDAVKLDNNPIICGQDFINNVLLKNAEVEYRVIYDIEKINFIFKNWAEELKSFDRKRLNEINLKDTKQYVKLVKNYYIDYFMGKEELPALDKGKLSIFPDYIIELLKKRRTQLKELIVENRLKSVFEFLALIKTLSEKPKGKKKTNNYVGNLKEYNKTCLKEDIEHFIKLHGRTKMDKSKEGLRSSLYLQTQKEIFLDPDFTANLGTVTTREDLIKKFPIIGLGIHLLNKVNMGSIWDIKIRNIAKLTNIIDSTSLESYQKNISNKMEYINGIVPLFTKEDKDIQPLVKTNLYHGIVSCLNSGNYDYNHKLIHFSLLANIAKYILSNKLTDWSFNLLTQIYSTLDIVYGNCDFVRIYLKTLFKEPFKCFILTSKSGNLDKGLPENLNCEDMSKAIFLLSYAVRNLEGLNIKFKKNVNIDFFEKCFDKLICEHLGRTFANNEKKRKILIDEIYSNLFKNNNFPSRLNDYLYASKLKVACKYSKSEILKYNSIRNLKANILFDIYLENCNLTPEQISHRLQNVVNIYLQTIDLKIDNFLLIYSNLFNKKYERQINFQILHALRLSSSYERMTKYEIENLSYDNDKIKYSEEFLKQIIFSEINADDSQINYFEMMRKEYNNIHYKEHTVLEHYEQGKINKELLSQMKIHPVYLTSLNCCLSEGCPMYLKIVDKKDLREHRECSPYMDFQNSLYKNVLLNLEENSETIYKLLIDGFASDVDSFDLKNHIRNLAKYYKQF
jgi:hypothetical protein